MKCKWCGNPVTKSHMNHPRLYCNKTCASHMHNEMNKRRRHLEREVGIWKRRSVISERFKEEQRLKKIEVSAHRSGVMSGDCGDSYFDTLSCMGSEIGHKTYNPSGAST